MANVEKSGYMKYKDKSGNMTTMYPKTKVANVEGLEDWDSAMLLKSAQATLPRAMSWRSVCYGNGKFVAVAYGTNIAAYSTDGVTWTQTAMPDNSTWRSVCYGDGKFVAVSYGAGGIAAYSSDGVTWTQTAMPDAIDKWCSVCYGNGKFVAISYGNAAAAYSTDGINWTLVTLIDAKYWQSVCYGNGRFVIITANYSSVVLVSTDGITWSQRSSNVALNWHTVCYGDGKFVALAYDDTGVVYSTDGVNWSRTNMPVKAYWETICYDNGRFVAIARNKAIAAYSTDGITWTQTAMPDSSTWQSVCYGDGKFVAVAASSKNVAVSADGVTWSSGIPAVKNPTGTDVTSDLRTVLGVDTILSDLAGKETSGAAATALSDAKAYTDQKIADIPTPESDILWVTYGDTNLTGQMLLDARDANKIVCCMYQTTLYIWAAAAYPIPDAATYVFFPMYGSPQFIENDDGVLSTVKQTKARCLLFTDNDHVGGGRTWSVFTKAKGFVQESIHASQHASTGADPITPASIGAATMTEVNTAIQSAIQNTWEASY